MPRNLGYKCRSRILSSEKARRKPLEAEMIKRKKGSQTRTREKERRRKTA